MTAAVLYPESHDLNPVFIWLPAIGLSLGLHASMMLHWPEDWLKSDPPAPVEDTEITIESGSALFEAVAETEVSSFTAVDLQVAADVRGPDEVSPIEPGPAARPGANEAAPVEARSTAALSATDVDSVGPLNGAAYEAVKASEVEAALANPAAAQPGRAVTPTDVRPASDADNLQSAPAKRTEAVVPEKAGVDGRAVSSLAAVATENPVSAGQAQALAPVSRTAGTVQTIAVGQAVPATPAAQITVSSGQRVPGVMPDTIVPNAMTNDTLAEPVVPIAGAPGSVATNPENRPPAGISAPLTVSPVDVAPVGSAATPNRPNNVAAVAAQPQRSNSTARSVIKPTSVAPPEPMNSRDLRLQTIAPSAVAESPAIPQAVPAVSAVRRETAAQRVAPVVSATPASPTVTSHSINPAGTGAGVKPVEAPDRTIAASARVSVTIPVANTALGARRPADPITPVPAAGDVASSPVAAATRAAHSVPEPVSDAVRPQTTPGLPETATQIAAAENGAQPVPEAKDVTSLQPAEPDSVGVAPAQPNAAATDLVAAAGTPIIDPLARAQAFAEQGFEGECAHLSIISAGVDAIQAAGFGRSAAEFQPFGQAYKARFGRTASITHHRVSNAQCRFLNALSASGSIEAPGLIEFDRDAARSGAAIAGLVGRDLPLQKIAEAEARGVDLSGRGPPELYLIEVTGAVRDLRRSLLPQSDRRTAGGWVVRIPAALAGGPEGSALLLAVWNRPKDVQPPRFGRLSAGGIDRVLSAPGIVSLSAITVRR